MMKRIISFLLTLLTFSPAHGWFDSGHMISSWIAWQEMTPEARKEAERLLLVLKEAEPKATDFITASTWFDEIKHRGFKGISYYWHTVSQNDLLPGIRHPSRTQDGVWLVREAIKTLSDHRSSDFAKAFMLRALIHVSQDLHQPLHVCIDEAGKSEYSNCCIAFKIKPVKYDNEQLDNLHALWDSGLTLLPPVRYYDPSRFKTIDITANQLLTSINEKHLTGKNQINPELWAQESDLILKGFALQNIKPNSEITESYIQQGQKIVTERILLSGFRLATVLNQTLGVTATQK